MARELRGTRYLTKRNEALAKFIVEELHYLDYTETMRWYHTMMPAMVKDDHALLGCNDRYYLLTALLGREDALHPWLFDRCREVEEEPDGRLDLWARYHYKSSIGTTAGIIQEILVDPEITVAIMSCTNDVARPFLAQIQQELETNDTLKTIYDSVLWQEPRKQAPLWSRDKGIIVKRKGNPKEATIEAFGLIDGMRTGRHFGLLVYDDLVTEKLITSPEMIQKVTERWELSDNLGQSRGTRKWHFGTRYSFGDTYGIILDRGTLKERRYAATDDGTLKGNPVFLSPERWAEVIDAQRTTAPAQMLLNPVAGQEAMFQAAWFKSYEVRPAVMNIYIMCDPSMGHTHRSDRTAIAVIGIDTAGNKYLLDGVRHRMKLSERWEHLKRLHKKWDNHPGRQALLVGYERYGMQSDVEVIKQYQERENYPFGIIELNWTRDGKHSKPDRISRLEPDMRNGRFYLPAVVWHPDYGGREGKATWSIAIEGDREETAKVVYRRLEGPTKLQRAMVAQQLSVRVVDAVKQIDEDRNVYDLTRAFMEEALFFPFAPHDDLIDVVSRIYDEQMLARPAVQYERGATEPPIYVDS